MNMYSLLLCFNLLFSPVFLSTISILYAMPKAESEEEEDASDSKTAASKTQSAEKTAIDSTSDADMSQLMGDDDQRKAFFAQFRKTQISKMLESESDRAHLMAQVDAWKAVKKSEEDAFAKKLKEQSLVASVVSA